MKPSVCSIIESDLKKILPRVLDGRNDYEQKSDESYVSKGDLLCQSIVIEVITRELDNVLVISEELYQEYGDTDIESIDYIVVIDPIDGTENFVSGIPIWGTGVSIYKGGVHLESLIALPEIGFYLKTGDAVKKYVSRITGISSSLNKANLAAIPEAFEYRMFGCTMYNMYCVITGSMVVYENKKGGNCWDILPGLNLALEHNCHVEVNDEKYNGEFLKPGTKYPFKVRQN